MFLLLPLIVLLLRSLVDANDGFELRITEPRDGDLVTSPVKVKVDLVVTNGSVANEIRSFPGDHQVCYAALGRSRCVSILKRNGSGLDIFPWGTSVQIVAWIQNSKRLLKSLGDAVEVVVGPPSTKQGYCDVELKMRIRGEYVDIEAGRGVRVAVGDFFAAECHQKCTVHLPHFDSWKIYAWTGDDCAPITRTVSTRRDHRLKFSQYAHPRGSRAWLSDSANFTVDVPPSPRVAACLLERHVSCGNACHYFQHSAPFLTACWSFFQKYAHLRPVLVLRDGLYLGNHRWTRGLLNAMGCEVVEQTIPRHAVTGRMKAGATSWDPSTPGTSRDLGWTPLSWLASSAHAAELHRRVVTNRTRRKIGVLDRGVGVGGSLVDADALAARLELDYDDVDLAYFENLSFEDQANWINSHDVVISPHGAQLTNLIFLQPCAAILELYPPFYYVPGYFLTLALNVGALAYVGYPGEAADDDVARMLSGGPHAMNRFRTKKIDVDDLDALSNAVGAMIEERTRCLGEADGTRRHHLEEPTTTLAIFPRIPGDRCHEAGKHAEIIADTGSIVRSRGEPWSLCLAALGERSCFRVFDDETTGAVILPNWPGRHVVRVTAWLEQRDGDWISPQATDVTVCGGGEGDEEGGIGDLRGIELRLAHPLDGSRVPNPIAAQLVFDVDETRRNATSDFDFRTFRVCYASLDQRRCSLLWPHQRGVSSDEATVLGLPQFSLPVTTTITTDDTPRRAKSTTHQLCAWIEADGKAGVVVSCAGDIRVFEL